MSVSASAAVLASVSRSRTSNRLAWTASASRCRLRDDASSRSRSVASLHSAGSTFQARVLVRRSDRSTGANRAEAPRSRPESARGKRPALGHTLSGSCAACCPSLHTLLIRSIVPGWVNSSHRTRLSWPREHRQPATPRSRSLPRRTPGSSFSNGVRYAQSWLYWRTAARTSSIRIWPFGGPRFHTFGPTYVRSYSVEYARSPVFFP